MMYELPKPNPRNGHQSGMGLDIDICKCISRASECIVRTENHFAGLFIPVSKCNFVSFLMVLKPA